MDLDDGKDFNPYEGADVFAVVRNPYDRILSQYYYRTGFFKTVEKLNSVEYMNNRIRKYLLIAKNEYLYSNGHYIPQYDFIYAIDHYRESNTTAKPKRNVKHVLRYEHLQKDFEKLMKEYNLNIQLHAKNDNQASPTRKRESNAKLSKYDLYPETCQLIEDYYEKDFIEFGYSKLNRMDLKHPIIKNTKS